MTARISKCGHCGETQFTNWYSKSAPRDRYGRMDRDYMDSEPVAYCSEEHRDAADELADAVAALGALPMPVGPPSRTLDRVEDELSGVSLSLYEEELTTARLRLALKSAKRGRSELRARVAVLEAERHTTNEALDDAVQELRRRDTPAAPYAATPETHASMRAALARHYSNARHGACENCGAAPENWCPDCAACEQGCFGGFDGNNCPHSNAKWGGR